MCKGGGGTNTVVQNSQPPQQFLDAYSQAVQQAQGLAAQPYQQYPGNLQAGLSPDQLAAIGNIQSAQGVSTPYINSAAQYINNSTQPLAPSLQGYFQGQDQNLQAQQQIAAGIQPQLQGQFGYADQNLQAEQGIGAQARGTVNPFQQLGSPQINQYLNPYLNQVVGATQAQFNNQNQQQANQLAGNAVSSGAFGGDREAIAQATLANQQQLAQAPVIAGLESQGYQQAVQTAQQQQQQELATQQAQLQGLGLAGNMYQNNAAALMQQAGLGLQGYGLAGNLYQNNVNALGQQAQMGLGANEANAWLNSQAGYGMANLGNEALNSTLTGANALLGVGGLEQQQAQQSLNIPYEQFLAAQSWPYQTAGWEAGIAEGLGSAAGGQSSTKYPGPSVGSQIAGTALTGAGLLGMTGAFGNAGWLTGAGAGMGATDALAAGTFSGISPAVDAALTTAAAGTAADVGAEAGLGALALAARGGAIPHRASGGSAPVSVSVKPGSYAGSPDVPVLSNGGGGGMAPAAGTPQGLNDYLASTAASAHPAPPPVAPPPAAPPPAAGAPAAAAPAPQGPPALSPAMQAYQAGGPFGVYQQALQAGKPWEQAYLASIYANAGSPDYPIARGGHVPLEDGGVPAMGDDTPAPVGGMGASHADPWRSLLYAGLGIMGGSSPNAATNIGRGALQGLQVAERERQTDALNSWRQQQGNMMLRREQNLERHQNETEQQAAQRLADEAEWHRNQLKHQDEQTDIARGNQALHRDEFEERKNQFWNGTQPWRQGNQDIALSRAITSADLGQQRADQTGQRIDLSRQRLENLQHYQQQSLDLRKQALDQTKDATDRRMIQTATNQVLNGARSIILAHPEIKWADAVKMAGQSQGNVQSNVEPPPSALPAHNAPQGAQPSAQPAAPDAPAAPPPSAIEYLRANPALAPAFQQKYGIDPRQFLSPGG